MGEGNSHESHGMMTSTLPTNSCIQSWLPGTPSRFPGTLTPVPVPWRTQYRFSGTYPQSLFPGTPSRFSGTPYRFFSTLSTVPVPWHPFPVPCHPVPVPWHPVLVPWHLGSHTRHLPSSSLSNSLILTQPGYSSRKALEEPQGDAYKTCIARERGREGVGL